MAVEQDAELVDAVDNVVLAQDVPGLLRHPAATRHLMQREDGVVARMIGVVAGRPIDHPAVIVQREVVGDRDRLVVRHQKPVLGLRGRRPGSNPGAGARARQIDRGITAELMMMRPGRHGLFVGPPA